MMNKVTPLVVYLVGTALCIAGVLLFMLFFALGWSKLVSASPLILTLAGFIIQMVTFSRARKEMQKREKLHRQERMRWDK
jgi:hypothetical protein